MSFIPIKRIRIADQVAAAIRDANVGGRYDPGDSLPAERDLAEQFGVNRSSVREAIRRLESWGLVVVRHGGGTRVADFLASANLHILPFLLAPKGELDVDLLRDLLDLRVMIVTWTEARAADRAGPVDADALAEVLERLDQTDDIAQRQEIDFEFFERLVAMTDNRVLILLIHAVRRVYLQNRDLFLRLYAEQVFDSEPLWAAVNAIRAGDTEGAGDAMRRYAQVFLAGLES